MVRSSSFFLDAAVSRTPSSLSSLFWKVPTLAKPEPVTHEQTPFQDLDPLLVQQSDANAVNVHRNHPSFRNTPKQQQHHHHHHHHSHHGSHEQGQSKQHHAHHPQTPQQSQQQHHHGQSANTAGRPVDIHKDDNDEDRIVPVFTTKASSSLSSTAAAPTSTVSGTRAGHHPRSSRRRNSSLPAELRLDDDLMASYLLYVPAEPVFQHTDTIQSTQQLLVAQISAALSDAIAAVDLLRAAAHTLESIAADTASHSSQLRRDFFEACDQLARAVHVAPVLVRRGDMIAFFAQKRILVTHETSAHAARLVRRSERWLSEIVKDIGTDLLHARREARRVGSLDSMDS